MCDLKIAIENLNVGPNEALVARIDGKLNSEEFNRVSAKLREALPSGILLLIIDDGIKLTKVTRNGK